MHACLRHVKERLFRLWYRSHLSTDMIMPIPIILFGFISNRYRYICFAPYQTDTDNRFKPIIYRYYSISRLSPSDPWGFTTTEKIYYSRCSFPDNSLINKFLLSRHCAVNFRDGFNSQSVSTVNIHCNFLVLRQPTPARNICIDDIVESCKLNCNLGSTSNWWILTFSAHCRL